MILLLEKSTAFATPSNLSETTLATTLWVNLPMCSILFAYFLFWKNMSGCSATSSDVDAKSEKTRDTNHWTTTTEGHGRSSLGHAASCRIFFSVVSAFEFFCFIGPGTGPWTPKDANTLVFWTFFPRGHFSILFSNTIEDSPLQRAGSQGFSLKLLPIVVVDAENVDLEPVGEDKTGVNEEWGCSKTTKNEMDLTRNKDT